MKAAVLHNFREPFVIEDIEPKGEGERVEVYATGICGRDLVIWKGGFKNLRLPLVLGHEIFGYHNGEPVAVYPNFYCGECKYCKSGKENLCDMARILGEDSSATGGYAEEVIVPERNLIKLPDEEFTKYAAATDPVATAIHSSKLVKVNPDDRVLVTGAGGGVGVHLIQYLKYLGVKDLYGLTSKADKLKQLGVNVISEITREMKFDVIFELVGSPTINDSLRALDKEGRMALIGNVEGTPINIMRPALSIMRQHLIVGSAAYTKKEYEEAIKLIYEGVIKPFYTAFKLEEINEAYKNLLERKIFGRAVLKIR
ncbi:MAG: alcohol dehydrogenase catalytic domain-containing protein [Sulfolobaceae archaeon]|nr:alcohol dehydrogenase catalytic domain-containing protein [Sulfolobaceae archaeon]